MMPPVDLANVARFDQAHAAAAETLTVLAEGVRDCVDLLGECRGLAWMHIYLTEKYGEVNALALLLTVALYQRTDGG